MSFGRIFVDCRRRRQRCRLCRHRRRQENVKQTKQKLIKTDERRKKKEKKKRTQNALALLDSVVTVQFSRIINHILKWLNE